MQTGVINDELEYSFLLSHRASSSFCEVRICRRLAKIAQLGLLGKYSRYAMSYAMGELLVKDYFEK